MYVVEEEMMIAYDLLIINLYHHQNIYFIAIQNDVVIIMNHVIHAHEIYSQFYVHEYCGVKNYSNY